jgi:hypothetical protein
MKLRTAGLGLIMATAVSVWACNTSNPARPTMSFVAPVAQQPASGIAYAYSQQPVSVSISNIVRTGTGKVTYSVEVSTSSTFASTVFTRDGIAEGNNGTTGVTLPQLVSTSPNNITYYWRWRAVVDGIVGEPSAPQTFVVRPNIIINTPGLQAPAIGSELFTARPVFTISNATRTGPAGTISYEFQVSTSAAFGTLLATATVQEQASNTSWTPTVDMPEATLFWRARARDIANAIDGGFSSTFSFQRRFGIDIKKAVVAFGPANMINWPETARLTSVYFDPNDTEVLCTEYDDPGWPETLFFGGPDTVYANQVMFVNREGTWYAGVAAWMRSWPQFCKRDYDQEFFHDSLGHQWPFTETVLHSGDILGVMMTTPSRAWPDMSTRDERSNIVLVAWPPGR